MTTPEIDWNEVWQAGHSKHAHAKHGNPKFWNKRAPEFTRAVSASDYVLQFLKILAPDPEWTVLDVGCAAGTLAVPLGKQVRSVTAMDPSDRMRELLQERCDKNSLSNVRILEGRWQDDWTGLGVEPHDVVIGSRSLVVDDLRAAIIQAHTFARKRVVLSTLVGEGPTDHRIIEATGRTFNAGADYIIVVNLLRQMGIYADVAFTYNERNKVYPDMDAAVDDYRWMVQGMSAEEEDRLRGYLTGAMRSVEGGLTLPGQPPVRWAVLSWDKTTGCDGELKA